MMKMKTEEDLAIVEQIVGRRLWSLRQKAGGSFVGGMRKRGLSFERVLRIERNPMSVPLSLFSDALPIYGVTAENLSKLMNGY